MSDAILLASLIGYSVLVGRLVGGVAHDINNILNAIMGSSFALNHEVADRGRLEDLENIITACDRGAQLLR